MSNVIKKPGVGVGVMILRDNKVLLGLRHEDPEKADSELHGEGTWTMPGGKLDFGETILEGVHRETKEENGLELGSLKIISVNDEILPDAHFVTIGVLCEDSVGNPEVLEPDEITEWRWFGLDNLPKNIFSPSRKVLENYKQKKIYIEKN